MSTSAAALAAFQTLPENIRRGILEGGAIRVYAARLSLARCGDGYGWAIDTQPRDGRPEEWERVTQRIGRIVLRAAKQIDPGTRAVLQTIATLTDEDLEVFTVGAWLAMDDAGGSLWTTVVSGSLSSTALPAVIRVSGRVKEQVSKLVCSL